MPDTGGGFTYFRSGAERAAEHQTDEPEASPESPPTEPSKDKPVKESKAAATDDYPEDGTIPEVKDWIGEDLDRAQEAYDREQDRAGGPRVTLVDHLNDLLADDDDES